MLPIRWDYLPYSFNKKNGKQYLIITHTHNVDPTSEQR